jgi:hypothetical protein
MSPIGSRLVRGAASGVVASATMTVAFTAFKMMGLLGELPPKKLTRRVLTLFGLRPSPGLPRGAATLAAHVAYGAGMGALYGVLPRPARSVLGGTLFGAAVWAVSYAGWIPKLGLMRPPSLDRRGRPTAMILAHLVYGATLGFTERRLTKARLHSAPSSAAVRDLPPAILA